MDLLILGDAIALQEETNSSAQRWCCDVLYEIKEILMRGIGGEVALANDTSRIKDLTPTATVSDYDVVAVDSKDGTKGVCFEDLSSATREKLAASVQEIKNYLDID